MVEFQVTGAHFYRENWNSSIIKEGDVVKLVRESWFDELGTKKSPQIGVKSLNGTHLGCVGKLDRGAHLSMFQLPLGEDFAVLSQDAEPGAYPFGGYVMYDPERTPLTAPAFPAKYHNVCTNLKEHIGRDVWKRIEKKFEGLERRCAISGESPPQLVLAPRWKIDHDNNTFELRGFQLVDAQLQIAQDRLLDPSLETNGWEVQAAIKTFTGYNGWSNRKQASHYRRGQKTLARTREGKKWGVELGYLKRWESMAHGFSHDLQVLLSDGSLPEEPATVPLSDVPVIGTYRPGRAQRRPRSQPSVPQAPAADIPVIDMLNPGVDHAPARPIQPYVQQVVEADVPVIDIVNPGRAQRRARPTQPYVHRTSWGDVIVLE